MVERWVLIVLLLGWVSSARAALEVSLNKSEVQLGEALTLQIKSATDLSELDLSPLTRDFDVTSQTLNRAAAKGRTFFLLEATLYPLRSGALIVPQLSLGASRSRPLSMRVHNSDISMHAWFPANLPIEREPTVLHVEIRDDGSLSWDTPIKVDMPHAAVRPLSEKTFEEVRDGMTRTVHSFRWQVLPLKAGSLTAHFGLLDAHRNAQRLRFPMRSASLTVRAAPAYLPLHLPIGRPLVHVGTRPKQLFAAQPISWNIDIKAPGLTAAGMKSLLQYAVPPGLKMYPPSIATISTDSGEALRITLSMSADRRLTHYPAIYFPYYDPRQQRIQRVTLPAQPVLVRDLAREKFFSVGIAVITVLFSLVAAWLVSRHVRRERIKRHWLLQVRDASTPICLYRTVTQRSPWGVPTLKALPQELQFDTETINRFERSVFAGPDTTTSFLAEKEAWVRRITRLPLRVIPLKSYKKVAEGPTRRASAF